MSSNNSKNSDKKKLHPIGLNDKYTGNIPNVNMDNRRGSREKFIELQERTKSNTAGPMNQGLNAKSMSFIKQGE